MDFEKGEILLVDKPLKWTSFDVVNKLRYSLKKKTGKKLKVGHAGTLDPLATGLLIICTGKYTKQLESYQGYDKEYTGAFLLGKTTPSYDLETAFDSEQSIDNITEEQIRAAALSFLGENDQMPPIFSAIKVDGKTSYAEARAGNVVELKTRKITIHGFDIERIELPYVYFRVNSSKGTYIRSIAHDFGKALGCGACLTALRRTGVGEFRVGDARSVEQWLQVIQSSGDGDTEADNTTV
jgi:tRNA pseudouridine55 synthase